MKFQTMEEAQEYLYSFRRPNDEQISPNFRFERVQYFAHLLGDPQNKIKVIHIAGTSGKGSTTSIISHLLIAHGKKTGLSISPHMYDLRERFQVNNELLQEGQFLKYVEEITPEIERMKETEYGPVSFFEISMVLAYYIFYKEKVDYAVMETGAGGRVDASNVASGSNKVAVITKIGLDHIDLLGKTLGLIASQKADIIHENNIAISVKQRPAAEKAIELRARKMNSPLNHVVPEKNFKSVRVEDNVLTFDYKYKELNLPSMKLSLNGLFQAENASIALAALYEASKRDHFKLDERIIRQVMLSMKSPGRFEELFIGYKKVIIDGAHNTQKMSAFIKSLKKKYPDQQFDFLIAFKHGKDYPKMMKYFVPIASKIFVTRFVLSDQILHTEGEPIDRICNTLTRKYNFTDVEAHEPSKDALEAALASNQSVLVITGSIYFIGELYRELIKRSQMV